MTAISLNKPKSPLARLSAGSIVLGVVSVVIAVALIGPVIDGGLKLFLQRIFDSLNNGAVYAVTAIALVLIFKATTLINFAGANIAMFGAYICWWVSLSSVYPSGSPSSWPWPSWPLSGRSPSGC